MSDLLLDINDAKLNDVNKTLHMHTVCYVLAKYLQLRLYRVAVSV